MGFLMEFLIELLFELPIDAAMESKRLRTGLKTAIYGMLAGGLVALFTAITISMWRSGENPIYAFIMTLLTAAMAAGVVYGCIHGHRKKWKNE